ncbi:hypothetical protein SJAG_03390 [Schizosaccharomyces japonicus yFS275]|uniref:Uncharacterized protein n=1 Tax=Schizosaccharomyces japonicus (strain yFS275 / FY16936) TaxID=402676 RepID=B6K439_SCHJY|nr:hypothetical protein SJAG_03390 [Schizosaccharomyces japonicus yFS275]EEB08246.1 hypothetical protein SJAG_03390 [Schizosaccharomyces japonicus yFS275]
MDVRLRIFRMSGQWQFERGDEAHSLLCGRLLVSEPSASVHATQQRRVGSTEEAHGGDSGSTQAAHRPATPARVTAVPNARSSTSSPLPTLARSQLRAGSQPPDAAGLLWLDGASGRGSLIKGHSGVSGLQRANNSSRAK